MPSLPILTIHMNPFKFRFSRTQGSGAVCISRTQGLFLCHTVMFTFWTLCGSATKKQMIFQTPGRLQQKLRDVSLKKNCGPSVAVITCLKICSSE